MALTVTSQEVVIARQQRPVRVGPYTGGGLIEGSAVIYTFPITDMDPSTQPLSHEITINKVAANLPPHAVAACNLSIDLKIAPGGPFFLISATPLYPAKDIQDPSVAASRGLMSPSAPPRYMVIREARIVDPAPLPEAGSGKQPAPAEAGPAEAPDTMEQND